MLASPSRALVLCLALSCSPSAQPTDPLAGTWTLNLAKSYFGPSVDRRTNETFTCRATGRGVECRIRSVRADGRTLLGTFTAAYDGMASPVAGIPDVDQVSLRKVDDFVADATFNLRGRSVFAYRSIKASDGRSLTIVSVDPETRAVLNSVVVYDGR